MASRQYTRMYIYHISLGSCKAEHRAVRYKLKSCTVPILVPLRLSNIPVLLYRPDVCNCTVPYVPRTVPAYAVRDPAQTGEVVAQWGVIQCTTYNLYICKQLHNKTLQFFLITKITQETQCVKTIFCNFKIISGLTELNISSKCCAESLMNCQNLHCGTTACQTLKQGNTQGRIDRQVDRQIERKIM